MTKAYSPCPTLSLIHILGKRWTIPIVEVLYASHGKIQFNTMQLLLGSITPKNLSNALKELVEAEIVSKKEVKKRRILHTEYKLTEKGIAFEEFIRSAKSLGINIYDMNPNCVNRQCNKCELAIAH